MTNARKTFQAIGTLALFGALCASTLSWAQQSPAENPASSETADPYPLVCFVEYDPTAGILKILTQPTKADKVTSNPKLVDRCISITKGLPPNRLYRLRIELDGGRTYEGELELAGAREDGKIPGVLAVKRT